MDDKIKLEMEFPIHASPQLLFQYISTPSGLSEWFADNVNSRGEVFTFIWNDSQEKAKLLSKKSGERIRFRWMDDDEDGETYYFEIKIQVDEITKDVSIIVTDFIEPDEMDEAKMLWENQISDLKQVLGSA
ncbi:MAG: START-like domain-containing protein [Gelidibacter sp.]